jgi:uncharacterized protein involved in exopolysaccharide biosynthesis
MDVTTGSPLDLLRRHAIGLAASALVGAGIAVAGSFLITPAYRSDVVVALVKDTGSSDLMMSLGSLGGLGALAGLGLGGDTSRNERIAVLTSRELATSFLKSEQLVERFCETKAMKCGPGLFFGSELSEVQLANDARKLFQRRVLGVTEDKRTSLVRVSITWRDPAEAASWANEYVELANRELLARAISESDRRIGFLRKLADEAETVELRDAVFKLLESEVKSRMVASSRADYAFKVIDPAVVPDLRDKVRPKRALMAVLGALIAALIFAVVRLRKAGHLPLSEGSASAAP